MADFLTSSSKFKDDDVCKCGHTWEVHDGGMGNLWCDGKGTHNNPFYLGDKSLFCQCTKFELVPRLKEFDIKKIGNTIENYKEQLDTAYEQIFQACQLLGIDTERELGDGWTLLERCKEINQMGVVPKKLECPKCHFKRAWSYPTTVQAGYPDPGFVRCAGCEHLWIPEPPKNIIVVDK